MVDLQGVNRRNALHDVVKREDSKESKPLPGGEIHL
jgi:hypothetical protein